jgi:hypothetical protein
MYGSHAPKKLREAARVFSDLYYYWSAAIVNSGDVFGYLPFIIEHKADFVAVGAHGTLKALKKLIPFYRQQQKLRDEKERSEYAWRNKAKLAPGEALAEGVHEFARLLLAYALKNLPVHDHG